MDASSPAVLGGHIGIDFRDLCSELGFCRPVWGLLLLAAAKSGRFEGFERGVWPLNRRFRADSGRFGGGLSL